MESFGPHTSQPQQNRYPDQRGSSKFVTLRKDRNQGSNPQRQARVSTVGWEETKRSSSKAMPNLQGLARDKSKPQAQDRRNPNLDARRARYWITREWMQKWSLMVRWLPFIGSDEVLEGSSTFYSLIDPQPPFPNNMTRRANHIIRVTRTSNIKSWHHTRQDGESLSTLFGTSFIFIICTLGTYRMSVVL